MPASHRERGVKGIASLLLHYLDAVGFINPRRWHPLGSIKVVLVFPLSSGLPIVCGGVGFTSLHREGKLLRVIPEWCGIKCQNRGRGNKAQGTVSSKWFTDRSQKQRFALPNYSLISLIKLLSLDVIQNSKSTLQKKPNMKSHHLHNLLSEIWNSCDRQNISFKLFPTTARAVWSTRVSSLPGKKKKITHTHTENLPN